MSQASIGEAAERRAERIASGRATVYDVLDATNWKLLKEQRLLFLRAIQDSQDAGDTKQQIGLDGLLHWIDALQDAAAAEGYPMEFFGES